MVRFTVACELPFAREDYWRIRASPRFLNFIVHDGLLKSLVATPTSVDADGWAVREQTYIPATVDCPAIVRAVVGDTAFAVTDQQRWNDALEPFQQAFKIRPSFLAGLSRTSGTLTLEPCLDFFDGGAEGTGGAGARSHDSTERAAGRPNDYPTTNIRPLPDQAEVDASDPGQSDLDDRDDTAQSDLDDDTIYADSLDGDTVHQPSTHDPLLGCAAHNHHRHVEDCVLPGDNQLHANHPSKHVRDNNDDDDDDDADDVTLRKHEHHADSLDAPKLVGKLSEMRIEANQAQETPLDSSQSSIFLDQLIQKEDRCRHVVSGECRVSIHTVGWFVERAIIHNLTKFYDAYPKTVGRFRQWLLDEYANGNQSASMSLIVDRFLADEADSDCLSSETSCDGVSGEQNLDPKAKDIESNASTAGDSDSEVTTSKVLVDSFPSPETV